MDLWEEFFTELGSFIQLCSREDDASVAVAETTLVKLDCYIDVLWAIINTLREEPRM